MAVNYAAKFVYISDVGSRFSSLLGDFMQNNMQIESLKKKKIQPWSWVTHRLA